MLIVQDRVPGLRALVLLLGHLINVLLRGCVSNIMVVIAIGVCNGMVSTRLVILELVLLILLKRGVEVLFLVCPFTPVS